MRTLDYTTLIINGFIGFLIVAVGNGLCYYVASSFARSISSRTWSIYFIRLAFVLILSVLWIGLLWIVCFWRGAAEVMGGNLNDPYLWYRWAMYEGMGFGALSVCAWIVVALIDRPKAKHPKIQAATLG